LKSKLAYSVGAVAAALSSQAFAAYIIFFYVDIIKLPPYLAAIGMVIFAVWNAINDPIAGFVSDHTHSRWGRRIPYIAFGAIPLGLVYFLLWSPPFTGLNQVGLLFVYFVSTICLFDLFYSFTFINWSALYPEMFTTLKERSTVNALRQTFVFIGFIFGVALPPAIYSSFGWPAMGAIFGFIIAVCLLISLLGSREHIQYSREKQLALWPSIVATFKNRSFMTFVFANLFAQTAFLMVLASLPFFGKYILDVAPVDITVVLAIAFLIALPMLYVWRYVSVKLGAKKTFMAAVLVTGLSLLPLFLVRSIDEVMLPTIFIASGIAGILMMVDIILSDIIDEDELHTGTRREGMYFGIHAFILRFSLGLQGLVMAGVFIFTTYNPYVYTQTREFVTGLRWLIAGFPALALILSFVIISYYPLVGKTTFKKLHKDLEKLHDKKGVND